MSTKTLFILTGAAAWVGGIVTAMAALSCDVETCETDPQPSAIVRFYAMHGSTRVPVRADAVRFQVHAEGGDPQTDLAAPPALQSGRCFDDACTQWAVGWDEPGRVEIWADACRQSYTAEVSVEMDAMVCHAETQLVDIKVDDSTCPMDPERLPPWECDKMSHPSVHVYVAKQYDDYFAAVDVDAVWFEHRGQTFEARCLQSEHGCMAWIAGYELEGPITVSTEYCDTVVSKTVEVEKIPYSCHVQTEYVMLEVSTRGCLTGQVQEDPPPPPQWPWDLTTAVATSERPAGAATDLTNRIPVKRPAGAPTDLTTPHNFPPPPTRPGGVVNPGG